VPEAKLALQLPIVPYFGGSLASQGSGSQVAALLKLPAKQSVTPWRVKPSLHFIVQIRPDGSELEQSPGFPFSTSWEASHGSGSQFMAWPVKPLEPHL
jgi:hypothetical protein